jgi:TolA-binding protein
VKEEFPDFPEQYEADYVIGLCKSSQADFAGAREAYEAVLRSPQGSRSETAAKAQYMIADSYLRQRNYEQALREYLRLENRYAYPELQAAAVFQAARCAEKLGRWTEVIDLYARLLKTYPRTSHAPEAAERLELARSQAAPSGV